jgi:hypothetical protein
MTSKPPIDSETIQKFILPLIPSLIPFIQAGGWYMFTKLDKRANALNNLIALAEIVPAVDLNIPKGVVLAALYDKTEDSLKILNDLVQTIKEIPITVKQTVADTLSKVETELGKVIPDIPDARKNLGWMYPIAGPAWILSCMAQKGFPVSTEWIKDKLDL